jgi:thiol-disulfide isomerase/thioredoxin
MDDSLSDASLPTAETKPTTFRLFLPLLLAGLFMITGICVLIFLGREKARIIGQTITELDIQPLMLAEKPIKPEDLKGKVAVFHFWGYWSKASLPGYPAFVELLKQYESDPTVLFVSIANKERTDDTSDALAFYTQKYFTNNSIPGHPVYHDPAEYSRVQISQLLTAGGFTYPTTLVIDGSGRVVDVWRSAITKSTLEKAIEKAKKQTAKNGL